MGIKVRDADIGNRLLGVLIAYRQTLPQEISDSNEKLLNLLKEICVSIHLQYVRLNNHVEHSLEPIKRYQELIVVKQEELINLANFLKGSNEFMKKKSTTDRKVSKVMREFSEGKLHSGSKSGPEVTNPKQAVAIGYGEARKAKKKGKK